jgi:hypothetical protein
LLLALVVLAVLVGLAAVGVVAGLLPITRSGTAPDPIPAPALPDGDHFAFVSVREAPPGGTVVVAVDTADLLTGETAHTAAVAAGAITDEEELPNDVWIRNDDPAVVPVGLPPDLVVTVLASGDDGLLGERVVTVADLAAELAGTPTIPGVYGLAPGQPVAMNLTVRRGQIVAATAVYLP